MRGDVRVDLARRLGDVFLQPGSQQLLIYLCRIEPCLILRYTVSASKTLPR